MYLSVIMILFYLNGNLLPEYLCICLYDFWLFYTIKYMRLPILFSYPLIREA